MKTVGEVAELAGVTVRALGFPLTEIAALLDDPGHDRLAALERQRDLIGHEIDRLGALAGAVDAAIAAHRDGTELEACVMFEGFDPSEYEEEARERWGDTDAYRESARRGANYGEADWNEIRGEAEQIVRELVGIMRAGVPADGPEAQALAERHRGHISRWFYPCSPQMHRGLGEMYLADDRFTQTYEREAVGLAAYFHAAILANAAGDGQASAPVSR